MPTIPKNKPLNLTQELFNSKVLPYGIDRIKYPIVTLGLRNYYDDAVGGAQNDRNFYDDAAALSIIKNGKETLIPFNFNTDPSIYRNATAEQKGIATLVKGVYYAHQLDFHKQKYLAMCQRAAAVKVTRDGVTGTELSKIGINIHSGGNNGTWSEGCQTLPPLQFVEYMTAILGYFDLDFKSLFKNPLLATQVEKNNFLALVNKNRDIGKFVMPYILA